MSRESHIDAVFASFRASPDPETVTLDRLNNFESQLPGGFLRVATEEGRSTVKDINQRRIDFYAEDDDFQGLSQEEVDKRLHREFNDVSLHQTFREFYATLEQVLFKHISREEYERLRRIVPFAAAREGGRDSEYYEAREKLGEALLKTYRELRSMGYTHNELIS